MGNKKESISRSLGKFTGEIWRALKAPAGGAEKHEVKRTVETEERDTPEGKVTLRRTTIEEIEFKAEPREKKTGEPSGRTRGDAHGPESSPDKL